MYRLTQLLAYKPTVGHYILQIWKPIRTNQTNLFRNIYQVYHI